MNIAYKIMSGKEVSNIELKYLLWLVLCERQSYCSEECFGEFDENEVFNVEDLLQKLDQELGEDFLDEHDLD